MESYKQESYKQGKHNFGNTNTKDRCRYHCHKCYPASKGHLQHLWITFGHGQTLKWISIHDLYSSLKQQKSKPILFFHALTSCDIVPALHGKGKRTAWQTWSSFPEATEFFAKLSQYPPIITDSDVEIIENFVIMINYIASSSYDVDEARIDMFGK